MDNRPKYAHLIKLEAKRLGFQFCGISKAEPLHTEANLLEQWLTANNHGEMQYMAENFDKRIDPTLLLPGAKSIVSLMLNYYPQPESKQQSSLLISKYAWGRDYHKVLKSKLKQLLQYIQTEIGAVNGRAFTDSAPIMDKVWAVRSGLGWLGKNTNVIHPKAGSFYFIGELVLDLDLQADAPIRDHCGTCTRCIDACPTQAISANAKIVDGSKCISYYTIELKKAIPTDAPAWTDWIFGCDVCQDVCPWNKFSKPSIDPDFAARPQLLNKTDREWLELTEDVFNTITEGSPIRRTGYEGIKRNIERVRSRKE